MPKPAALTIDLSRLKEGDVLLEEPDLAYSDALLAHVGQSVVKQTFRKGGDYLVRFDKAPSVLIEYGTTLLVERQVPTDEEQDAFDASEIAERIEETYKEHKQAVQKVKVVLDQYGANSVMGNHIGDAVRLQAEAQCWGRVQRLVNEEGLSLIEATARVGQKIGVDLLTSATGGRGRASGIHGIVHEEEVEGERRFLQVLTRWPSVARRSTMVEAYQKRWGR